MKSKKLTVSQKQSLTGWVFLSVAALLIIWMSFYPMIQGFWLSLHSGAGARMAFAGFTNYRRLLEDPQFRRVLMNTFLYLAVQVPVMLTLALTLAAMLNSPTLKFRGFFRTCIFLPCTTALVAYAVIFRSLFSTHGYINTVLMNLGLISEQFNWLGTAWSARLVIILGLTWRWTGFNMIFYLAGLQNIEKSIYDAAKIDGANAFQTLFRVTLPILKPIVLLTAIMSTNGTLQMFDESVNLTGGGPARMSMSIAHYIFNVGFQGTANFGYAATLSYVVLVLVATLAFIQLKVADRR